MDARQALCGTAQIELDDFRRARPDEEQHLDVRAALQQAADDAIEFLVRVGKTRQIALVDDRGRETRLGEDHHAGGRLHEMRASPRTDDQEERVLDLAMQPHDPGQPAEDFALTALAQDFDLARFGGHCAKPPIRPGACVPHAASRRASRSLIKNCAALIT